MFRQTLKILSKTAILVSLLGGSAMAQWSILAPGTREARPNNHRYAHLVYSNPVPGREVEFNEWYQNMHLGDLMLSPGFLGVQRFRIVTEVTPKPSAAGYQQGYLIIMDEEDADPSLPNPKNRPSPAWGFGGSPSMTYQSLGPRITRPDGKGPTLTNAEGFRPNRYILMDTENALPGKEEEFNQYEDQLIRSVLGLPGWMAAQRYVLVRRQRDRPQLEKAHFLTIWETEGKSAQEINDLLVQAKKSGKIKDNPAADQATADIVYWEPISPYVTRDDFER
jgi:hypothetical protein